MATINSLADRYGFSVVEDASHAIGGKYKGNQLETAAIATLQYLASISKNNNYWRRGIATTNDANLAQRMNELDAMA